MEGLVELFIFGILILAYLLESVFRKRKPPSTDPEGEGASGEWDQVPDPEEWEEAARTEEAPGPGSPEPAEARGRTEASRTSEDMVPQDIWEELFGVPGGPQAPPRPRDREEEPREEEPWRAREETAERETDLERPRVDHPREEDSGSGIGAGPGSFGRSPGEEEAPGGPSVAETAGTAPPEVEVVRRRRASELARIRQAAGARGGGGASSFRRVVDRVARNDLQRAVLYREILGDPLALRDREVGGRE